MFSKILIRFLHLMLKSGPIPIKTGTEMIFTVCTLFNDAVSLWKYHEKLQSRQSVSQWSFQTDTSRIIRNFTAWNNLPDGQNYCFVYFNSYIRQIERLKT
jgi:hypothetical protein